MFWLDWVVVGWGDGWGGGWGDGEGYFVGVVVWGGLDGLVGRGMAKGERKQGEGKHTMRIKELALGIPVYPYVGVQADDFSAPIFVIASWSVFYHLPHLITSHHISSLHSMFSSPNQWVTFNIAYHHHPLSIIHYQASK